MELLPNNYPFKVYYAGGAKQKSQVVSNGSSVDFATVEVTMTLVVDGSSEVSTDAKYYASGWKTFGSGATTTSMELLPNSYPFKVYYDGTSKQKSQNVGDNELVAFNVVSSGAAKSTTSKEDDSKSLIISSETKVYPNPFTAFVNITFGLEVATNVRLTVSDINGRLIAQLKNSEAAKGNYSIQWDGTNSSGAQVHNGIYFIKLEAGGLQEISRVVLNR